METADDNARPQHFSRRRFIIVGGTGLAATGLGTGLQPVLTAAAAAPTFTLDLVRRDDMAVLGFEFHNLALNTSGSTPMLNRVDLQQEALVQVRLGSQHLMEEPLPWEAGQPEPDRAVGAIKTKAVGPSRIAFLVPQTVKSFPYSEDGLFEWWRWVMRVHGRALAPDEPIPDPSGLPAVNTKPADLETDLLLVDWLHLSPDRLSTWQHPARPVTKNGRTELWHTTLRLRDEDGRPDNSSRAPAVRAVSFDAALPEEAPFTVLMPTEQPDAPKQIVRATTDYELDLAEPEDIPVIKPVAADLLLLSSIGSSVELAGNWGPGHAELSIAKWLHRSTLGRDNYVRVETRGFLFPFGHRATLVSETQRRIGEDGVAHLFQRRFIVIREFVKTYPAFGDTVIEGRRTPFREIRLTTTVTPDLPPAADLDKISAKSFWVPTRDPATQDVVDLPFPVVATDWEGRTVQFDAFLAYFDQTEAQGGSVLTNLLQSYDYSWTLTDPTDTTRRRKVVMSGDKIAFAMPDQPGSTAYPVTELFLGAYAGTAETDDLADRDLPNFYPAALVAKVRLPAVEALTGTAASGYVAYDPTFSTTPTAKAADNNQAGTFLRVQSSLNDIGRLERHLRNPDTLDPPTFGEVGVNFTGTSDNPSGDKVGGVAVPNLRIGALSPTFGPLSGDVESIKDLAGGGFDPLKFFPDDAKLLGNIPLKELVAKLTLAEGGKGPKIMTITEHGNGPEAPPTAVETKLEWNPKLTDKIVLCFVPKGADGKQATLELKGKFRTVFGDESTSEISGKLENFALNLLKPNSDLDFIAIYFKRFAFEQHNDAKPTFDPAIEKVEFRGPLSFINTLQEFLTFDGGPKIELEPNGVNITQDIPIPNVAVGVFSLQNMSFSAGLSLPFDGSLVTTNFGFASPENRFVVSVWVFGGGGYFLMKLNVERLVRLEAAIEFGGVLALNVVVASGSLSVMAGIYFALQYNEEKKSNDITLRGYLRATGKLSVLGLITVTAEFMLALEYKSADNSLEGIATLKVTVEVLFFSKTIEIEVRKKFAGPSNAAARTLAAGRPEFGDLMSQSDWNTYVDSFAG